jgi:hypothetical protein
MTTPRRRERRPSEDDVDEVVIEDLGDLLGVGRRQSLESVTSRWTAPTSEAGSQWSMK